MQFLVVIAFGLLILSDEIGSSPFIIDEGARGVVSVILTSLAIVLFIARQARCYVFSGLDSPALDITFFQRRYVSSQRLIRTVAVLSHFVLIYFTQWKLLVRGVLGSDFWGVDEAIIILPFVFMVSLGYYLLYPVDLAIREVLVSDLMLFSEPIRPIWSRWEYLFFQLRVQILTVGIPIMIIVSIKDGIERYGNKIVGFAYSIFGNLPFLEFLPEYILAVLAFVVFLLSPAIVRFIWLAEELPSGTLKRRLESLLFLAKARVSRILFWPSYGVIVNAAVVGIFPFMRYIMISDGLVESLTDRQIETVFAHEIGHIKRHHIMYYLVFLGLSVMLLVDVLTLVDRFVLHGQEFGGYGVVSIIGFGSFFYLFGKISRIFEREADLFAVELVSKAMPVSECNSERCMLHRAAGVNADSDTNVDVRCIPDIEDTDSDIDIGSNVDTYIFAGDTGEDGFGFEFKDGDRPCLTAACVFASALRRTAALNAIPFDAKSWRHGSIQDRSRFIIDAATDEVILSRFKRTVKNIKRTLLLLFILSFVILLLL